MTGNVRSSLGLLAADRVSRQLERLGRHLGAIPGSADTEPVHQARVASRRLRAALGVFRDCFQPKQVTRWRRALRRLLTGLGDARDRDVQIAYLEDRLAKCDAKPCRPGISRLLLRLRQQREALQPRLVKIIGRFQSGAADDEMEAAVRTLSPGGAVRRRRFRDPAVFDRARTHIRRRLQELLGYRVCLADPSDTERHHGMRIAAKRLRYAMEMCGPAFTGGLLPFIKAARGLQTLLGDLHDCDVWVADLQAFEAEETERTLAYCGHRRPMARLRPGIHCLRRERTEQRGVLFREVTALWDRLEREDLWGELLRILDAHAERPAPPSGDGRRPAAEERGLNVPPARRDQTASQEEGGCRR